MVLARLVRHTIAVEHLTSGVHEDVDNKPWTETTDSHKVNVNATCCKAITATY